MKLLKITLAALVMTATAYASDTAKTLSQNMKIMEIGLSDIQKGFLYNNKDLIEVGVQTIKDANDIFTHKDEIAKYLEPYGKKHMAHIADNAAKKMNEAADAMMAYMNGKDPNAGKIETGRSMKMLSKDDVKKPTLNGKPLMIKAHEEYSNIISACQSCHAVVRSW
jgi:hypothetical protein